MARRDENVASSDAPGPASTCPDTCAVTSATRGPGVASKSGAGLRDDRPVPRGARARLRVLPREINYGSGANEHRVHGDDRHDHLEIGTKAERDPEPQQIEPKRASGDVARPLPEERATPQRRNQDPEHRATSDDTDPSEVEIQLSRDGHVHGVRDGAVRPHIRLSDSESPPCSLGDLRLFRPNGPWNEREPEVFEGLPTEKAILRHDAADLRELIERRQATQDRLSCGEVRHLPAFSLFRHLVCRLLLEKKKTL